MYLPRPWTLSLSVCRSVCLSVRLSVFICVCIHTSIRIRIRIYNNTYIYVCAGINTCIYGYTYLYIWLYVYPLNLHLYPYVFLCLHIHIYISISASLYHLYIYIYPSICLAVCLSNYQSTRLFICSSICLSIDRSADCKRLVWTVLRPRCGCRSECSLGVRALNSKTCAQSKTPKPWWKPTYTSKPENPSQNPKTSASRQGVCRFTVRNCEV